MRPEIALPLQQVFRIYNVGGFLIAWRNPKTQRTIEQMFESPQQARHAAATCAAWLGITTAPAAGPVTAWWRSDDDQHPTMPIA